MAAIVGLPSRVADVFVADHLFVVDRRTVTDEIVRYAVRVAAMPVFRKGNKIERKKHSLSLSLSLSLTHTHTHTHLELCVCAGGCACPLATDLIQTVIIIYNLTFTFVV